MEVIGSKTCIRCHIVKPLTAFSLTSGKYYRSKCKPCLAAERREKYHTDPAVRRKQIAASMRWNANNPAERKVIWDRYRKQQQPDRQRYYTDAEYRERKKVYNREWQRRKYWADEAFREAHKARCRAWRLRKKREKEGR